MPLPALHSSKMRRTHSVCWRRPEYGAEGHSLLHSSCQRNDKGQFVCTELDTEAVVQTWRTSEVCQRCWACWAARTRRCVRAQPRWWPPACRTTRPCSRCFSTVAPSRASWTSSRTPNPPAGGTHLPACCCAANLVLVFRVSAARQVQAQTRTIRNSRVRAGLGWKCLRWLQHVLHAVG